MKELPKEGEVWMKLPHPGLCRMGWSLGSGIHVISSRNLDWGTQHQLQCGCLFKLADSREAWEGELRDYRSRNPLAEPSDPKEDATHCVECGTNLQDVLTYWGSGDVGGLVAYCCACFSASKEDAG